MQNINKVKVISILQHGKTHFQLLFVIKYTISQHHKHLEKTICCFINILLFTLRKTL